MNTNVNDPNVWEDVDESESTIIRLPTPAGRRPEERSEIIPHRVVPPAVTVEVPLPHLRNPLVGAAYALLMLVPRFRRTAAHPDPSGLRLQLCRQISLFEQEAQQRGVSRDRVLAARYALCSLVDEAVLGTPWGHDSIWSTQGLLVTYHQEVFGGEKFFYLLKRILPDPSGNRELLEFLYVCLALGFQGRFSLVQDGLSQLAELRERVGYAVQRAAGEYERELSPKWQGANLEFSPLAASLPLWVLLAGMGAFLVGGFLWFSRDLNDRSDLQFHALHALRSDAFLPKRELAAVPPRVPKVKVKRLGSFLAPEISAKLVTVEELPDRSTVRLSGDNLFASGSATINAAYHPVLMRIAEALNDVSGQVLITGHTDDRPIRSIRFPSNWHLSQARASAVLRLLERNMSAPDRLSFEGRGDTEPVAPNDVGANRARNRRVEITLLSAPAGE